MLYTIVGMLVIICDQVVKFWVDKNITYDAPVRELIPGVVSLVRVQNDGAAFSFLAGGGARVWFIVLTGIFTIMVILALATNFISGKFGRWCLVLVTAGGLSNCIDRILYGYVLDMFKVDLFNFAVFNVADIFITVFAILFIIYILFGGEKELEDDADEFDEEDIEPVATVQLPKRIKKEKVIREEIPSNNSFKRPTQKKRDDDVQVNRSYSSKDSSNRNINNMAASQEFEDFFAARRSASSSATRNTTTKAKTQVNQSTESEFKSIKTTQPKAVDSTDPFAEWDKANSTATNVSYSQAQRQAPVAQPAYQEPVKEAPKQSSPSYTSDDLDLDSILNEFK